MRKGGPEGQLGRYVGEGIAGGLYQPWLPGQIFKPSGMCSGSPFHNKQTTKRNIVLVIHNLLEEEVEQRERKTR